MYKKLYFLVLVVLVAALAGSASGDTNWTGAGDGSSWSDANNWDNGVPYWISTPPPWGTGEGAYIDDGAVILDVNGSAGYGSGIYVGNGATASLTSNGASLTNISGSIGIGNGAASDGTLNWNGGLCNIDQSYGNLLFGFQGSGTATVNLTGGTIKTSGQTYMKHDGDYNCYLNISGSGVLESKVNMSWQAGPGLELVTISGLGQIVTAGDETAHYQTLINAGKITAYGQYSVRVEYDGLNTIVTAANLSAASDPDPNNRQKVHYDSAGQILSWTPGTNAAKHNVYLGTSQSDVNESATPVSTNQDPNNYGPIPLVLNTTYYWRIEEVNEDHLDSPWEGEIWSFTTPGYILVDDFESYPETPALQAEWAAAGDGSVALSTVKFKSGEKSMALSYTNTTNYYSEAVFTYATAQDWTAEDVKLLDMFFLGSSGNDPEQLYVMLEDNTSEFATVSYPGSPNDLKTATQWWINWLIDPQDFVLDNLSFDITNVKKVYIGVGDRSATESGGLGTIYLDNIKLFRERCVDHPNSDLNGDCKVDFSDFAIFASKWLP